MEGRLFPAFTTTLVSRFPLVSYPLSSHCTPHHSCWNVTSPSLPQFLSQTPTMIVPHSIPSSRLTSSSSNAEIAPGTSCTSNALSAPQLSHLGIPLLVFVFTFEGTSCLPTASVLEYNNGFPFHSYRSTCSGFCASRSENLRKVLSRLDSNKSLSSPSAVVLSSSAYGACIFEELALGSLCFSGMRVSYSASR